MKCIKCRHTMEKVKEKDTEEIRFYFRCPNCGYTIGKKKETTDERKEE